MATMTKKSFDAPDDTRTPAKTAAVEVVDLGAARAARLSVQPGWRWSECIKPVVGGERCQARHVGFVTSGGSGSLAERTGGTFHASLEKVFANDSMARHSTRPFRPGPVNDRCP